MRARSWATALLLTIAVGCSRDWDGFAVAAAPDAQTSGDGGGSGVAGATGGFGGTVPSGGSGGTGAFAGTGGAVAECVASHLGSPCQEVWTGNAEACVTCMVANCCSETEACFSNQECAGLMECLSTSCRTASDPWACSQESCPACATEAAAQAVNAVSSCTQNNCLAECSG